MKNVILILACCFASLEVFSQIEEYCFDPTKLKIVDLEMTPSDYIKHDKNIAAVINGPSRDESGNTGIIILKGGENSQVFSCCLGEIRGWLYIGRTSIYAGNNPKDMQDIIAVIGTHPLLTVEGIVNEQAKDARYKNDQFFRSAIGTKDGKNLCFAASTKKITMIEWANLLVKYGFKYSINLGGRDESELVINGSSNKRATKKPSLLITAQ